ncbi:MAG: hypothetical protein HFI37_00645 [Lachnospiraceae bacterium]|nr:hypothetical protein [Lachnospiraceae bacterium]
MFEHGSLRNLDDYFLKLGDRGGQGVYFYRINGYHETVKAFILKYYEAARKNGVVIEGKIPNPDEKNLSYYAEMMGMDFQMNVGFFMTSLKKWLPRMNDLPRKYVAESLYDTLDGMRRAGKNDNILKNAYIKFMCWLYYKFERIINHLGEEELPKILYEGEISIYELKLMAILSRAGCDIVLLQYRGDQVYLKSDPNSELSKLFQLEEMGSFPEDFSLRKLQKELQEQFQMQKLYGTKPTLLNCTNAWIKGKGFEDFRTSVQNRGMDPNLFYNCFCRINGVEDKLTYLNELYQFQLELKNSGRKVVVLENMIPSPSTEEIGEIRRKNYSNQEQMLLDLSNNIGYSIDIELQRLMNKAFIDVMLEEAQKETINLNKLTNRAVYLLCWLRRYQKELFAGWKWPDISCLIYLGGCKNDSEAIFLKFLAKLPVDVLILVPNKNHKCVLEDQKLYEINDTESMIVEHYPKETSEIHMGTAAYHAERDLDEIMYQDSGIYRNQQYQKAVSVTLQTMYEEIAILWDQEVKYRPNFSIVDSVVNIPVIFAKVSGIKSGMVQPYWSGIQALKTGDTFLIKKAPFIQSTDPNPIKPYVTEFWKNGRLQRNKIKNHSGYPYGFLREEMQDHILNKLQLLIEQKAIKGTFENGTEYTIIATVLNLNRDIVRMIQKFDFTKKNPKLIYINTTEQIISLEDSILTAFLNLVGFDVVFFVPTGYQSVEKFFQKRTMEEHQIGDYVYDLHTPDMGNTPSGNSHRSWRERIFKRGS